jgi:hypothetical protein
VQARDANPWWGYWARPRVYAHGTRGLVLTETEALVLDLGDAAAPSVLRSVPLSGYAYSFASAGKSVLIAEGMQGVQQLSL